VRELLVPSQQASVDTGNLGASITENGLNLITGGTGTNDKIIYTNGAGGPGGIICRDANGTKYYYHFDRLGNVVGVTDSNGSVVSLYTMESFGNVLEMTNGGDFSNERSSDVQPYHLTTKEYDADTGLYYFGARWYDSTTGRWLSREPTQIDGPNLYHFCLGDPANWVDSDGLNVQLPPESPLGGEEILQPSPHRWLGNALHWLADNCDFVGAARAVANAIHDIDECDNESATYNLLSAGCMLGTMGRGNRGKVTISKVKRIPPSRMRKMHEQKTGKKWPKDPKGRNFDVSHENPLAEGGEDCLDNIKPRSRTDHISYHRKRGDFERWGGRRWTGYR